MTRFRLSAFALLGGLALPVLAGNAYAATPIDQTHPFSARGRISIENLKGNIVVTPWNRNDVKITGTLGDGVEKLEVDGDRSDLRVEVKYPHRRRMGAVRIAPGQLC